MESKTRCHLTTDLHACSIESVPSCSNSNVFLCGLYQLCDGETQIRTGGVLRLQYDSHTNSIEKLGEISLNSGVLDIKLCNINCERQLFGAVLSEGKLVVHEISSSMTQVNEIDKKEDGLMLSIDWNASIISTSTQNGSIYRFELLPDGRLEEVFSFHDAFPLFGENLPAWIVFSSPHCSSMLVGGGDNCTMRIWDLRMGPSSRTVKDQHNAGVTSGLWDSQDENYFFSGSYDESIRLWDQRNLKTPVQDVNTGGGVWRIKENINRKECSSRLIATASMHGGSHVFRYEHGQLLPHIFHKDSFNNHLSYGVDFLINSDQKPTLASCSFYDDTVFIWTDPEEAN